jgi:hypothetical protein
VESRGEREPQDGGPEDENGGRVRFVDWKVALAGGGLGALVAFGTMFALGKIGAVEARHLLQNTLPTIRFLSSSIATATATVLALMLTLLSVSHTTTSTLKGIHYQRIKQISWLCAVTIIASVFLLIFLALPLGEAEQFPTAWFDWVYYGVLTCSALLGGLFFSIVIMLLNAVQGLIGVVHPHVESGLVVGED